MADITMPQLGETVTEGTITKWFKAVGDPVAEDEPLFEVSTDKVDSEVPSPVSGTLTEIKVQEGDTVDVGVVLAVIGDGGAAPAAGPAAEAPPPRRRPRAGGGGRRSNRRPLPARCRPEAPPPAARHRPPPSPRRLRRRPLAPARSATQAASIASCRRSCAG